MKLIAIDPGSQLSAWALYDTATKLPVRWAKVENAEVLVELDRTPAEVMAIETAASHGMPAGDSMFRTSEWAGRFMERWLVYPRRPEAIGIPRTKVKHHLCGNTRAKDTNVRQAIINLYGGDKATAVGLKASPGPLYGLTADCWAALGVAITVAETLIPNA